MPVSRLPIKIGSDKSLGPNQSIYPVIHGLSIPINLKLLAFTLGAAATGFGVDATTLVKDWATRFAATFDEYCMTGLSFEVRTVNVSGIGQGLIYIYLDEKDSGVPTAAAAQASPRLDISINNAAMPIRHNLQWLARDVTDLGWTSTSSPTNPVYVKVFMSNTETGTANDTAVQLLITGSLNVDFRGYKNV